MAPGVAWVILAVETTPTWGVEVTCCSSFLEACQFGQSPPTSLPVALAQSAREVTVAACDWVQQVSVFFYVQQTRSWHRTSDAQQVTGLEMFNCVYLDGRWSTDVVGGGAVESEHTSTSLHPAEHRRGCACWVRHLGVCVVRLRRKKGLASYCKAETTFTFHFSILTLSIASLGIYNREIKSESDVSFAIASQPFLRCSFHLLQPEKN